LQDILRRMAHHVQDAGLQDRVQVAATFCFEKCDHGPTVSVDGNKIQWCTAQAAKAEIAEGLPQPSGGKKEYLDDDGKVISRRRLFARQDNVAEQQGIDRDAPGLAVRSGAVFGEAQRPHRCGSFGGIEAQSIRQAGGDFFQLLRIA